MPLEFSPLTADDLDAVLTLWSETEGVGLNESDTPELLRAYLDRNPGLSLVVRDHVDHGSTKTVAAILCGYDGRRGYLNHLAVAPAYRQRGIGTQLVDTCLASLRALGILRCNIFVYTHNHSGQHFWTHRGWSPRSDLLVFQRAT